MIGRSHAIHGEPITFGFKLAGWLAETRRNAERLERLERDVAVGQVSGAMGTYANTDPEVERLTCERLGLTPDTASTQVISRDRHADYIQTLALVGASLDRFATEIRNLQRTDVLEVEESFCQGAEGQLRDATQAQSDSQRTHQRSGQGAAQLRRRGTGKRGPLA